VNAESVGGDQTYIVKREGEKGVFLGNDVSDCPGVGVEKIMGGGEQLSVCRDMSMGISLRRGGGLAQ